MPKFRLSQRLQKQRGASARLGRWLTGRRWTVATWLLLALFVVGTAGSFWNLHQRELQLSRAFPLQGTALQVLTISEFRKLYSKEVVGRVATHGIKAASDYQANDHAIPLPAKLTMELGERISAARPGAHVRLYSDYPFPWRSDGGPRDDFEREALAALRQRPDEPYYRFEEFEGRPSLRYAVADRLDASCVNCHNHHADSPKRDWKLGDVRGVLEVIRPLDSEVAEGQIARQRDLIVTLIMASLGLVGLVLVYSYLRRTAATLVTSELRARAVLEAALDCIITIDHEGSVVEFNPAAEKVFGHRAQQVIGKPLGEFIIPQRMRAAHQRGIEHYLATGEGPLLGKRIEVTALRADGTEFPVELVIDVIHQAGPPLFTAFLRDVTERKQADAALARATEEKFMAEAASRAKSEFLARMSHEIRTPLSSILGFSEVLRRGVGTDAQRDSYLDTISSSGRHLSALIDDILDLSKIEAGRMEFERIRCSPHQIISEVLSVLRVRAAEKGLSLECRWTSGVPETILTDPARLRQLLMNLVGNAIKFTEQGGVKLLATVSPDSPEPRFVVEVSDTGIGIPADRIDSIFIPFEQADSSITRRFGGTGLGLAISRFIAQGLGGDITVESRPGTGSVFRVSVATGPLDGVVILDSPPTEAVAPARQLHLENLSRLVGSRVLLVEDGETNRELIRLVLQEAGAQVVCAENGQTGLEAESRDTFDVILMDMQMPVMDGYTAAQRLRDRGCKLPIIALTAHAMRGDKERCLAAGCSDYLPKPINIDDLLSKVADSLPKAKPTFGQRDSLERSAAAAGSGVHEIRPTITSTLPMNCRQLRELVESFIPRLQDRVEEMQTAYRAGDFEQLARLAHWLKGSAGTLGFDCFTEPAHNLELHARQHLANETEAILREIATMAGHITVAS